MISAKTAMSVRPEPERLVFVDHARDGADRA